MHLYSLEELLPKLELMFIQRNVTTVESPTSVAEKYLHTLPDIHILNVVNSTYNKMYYRTEVQFKVHFAVCFVLCAFLY